jgi:hypothetical protein
MRAVPELVPQCGIDRKTSKTRSPKTIAQAADSTEDIGIYDGAGRGNRTPMELLPTDFEFPKNAVSL